MNSESDTFSMTMGELQAASVKRVEEILNARRLDTGRLYDAMSAALVDQGVCLFRNCARGTRALVRDVAPRLYADSIRERQANN